MAIIKKAKKDFSSAFRLLTKAYELNPEDDTIKRNFLEIDGILKELKNKENNFKNSIDFLKKENNFVLDKLKNFLKNVKKETDFINGRMAIPNYKFKVLMGTDEAKAASLRQQWLEKNYILNSKERDAHNVIIYDINPFLDAVISDIDLNQVNKKWIQGFENITVSRLEEIGYFDKSKKIKKISKKYQNIVERDFDELVFNYLMGNFKTVIILSGSILEILLIYYLEKKKITTIQYSVNNKAINKDIYGATLNDLLQYFDTNSLISAQNFHLGNISRIYRNFIHPGKEVREQERLDNQKGEISFMSVMEMIDFLI